jgi:hypothetical protein
MKESGMLCYSRKIKDLEATAMYKASERSPLSIHRATRPTHWVAPPNPDIAVAAKKKTKKKSKKNRGKKSKKNLRGASPPLTVK